ncbi:hypothetical protein DBR32_15405 [Taibaiella sp. KBW10]|uniref:SAM hydrolase/SAM-dependent halogenase family protein n=1 Tax=Taibaiella sp. KBW10 TaxID=2153357 RepID=UPI000F59082C|nr:SAM-dependent chlorinase/fluorinase [Taibaiella sp. KBW10]RQO29643.1 hypothetical protein DBR32_15405 [Taibaiella sp. KBW10]
MIATFISDFGNKDNAVAIAKGLILKSNPELRLIDISHEIAPYDLLQCSYLLNSAFRNFPEETVHISMFDIMHRHPAQILFARIEGQIIISADNGMFTFTFPGADIAIWKYEAPASANYIEWLRKVANLIQEMHAAQFDFEQLKAVVFEPEVQTTPLRAMVKDMQIDCHVIHIDRFGNVVLNITQEEFEAYRRNRQFSIRIPRNVPVTQLSQNYNDVIQGERLCLFNSAGYLEIAIREGSAAQLLGLELFKKDQLIYNIIPIEFS